jgi:2-polyprenyl-3-methyl-5-hydroxy-6-metoxy-1,4-benzoquinol methylase
MIIRSNCCICNVKLENSIIFKDFPSRIGVSSSLDYNYNDLSISQCTECNTFQLNKLVPLDELYVVSHNNEIIGKVWLNHFIEFSKFIKENKENLLDVLEIGSPTDKIIKYIDAENYNKWVLLDPNAVKYDNDKVISINQFLDKDLLIKDKYNTIIHSHLIEHLYNPVEQLSLMNDLLDDNGDLFISAPNMEYYGCTHSPFLGIHFEHTYFLNRINTIYLLNKSNFVVKNIINYNTHSLFYHCKKEKNLNISIDMVKQYNITNKYFFDTKINYYKELVSVINQKILKCNSPIYIFGCQTNTLMLIYFKLNTENVKFILDNDKTKQNKYFYGTNLLCKSPEILSIVNNPYIICYIGEYTNEVKIQLNNINSNITYI